MKIPGQLKKLLLQLILNYKVHALRVKGEMVKVVIGAGSTHYEGWLMTDLHILDALTSSDWRRIFPRNSIDRILAEHVIEHWTDSQFCTFLSTIRPFLKSKGFIRIAVPDGFHPGSYYLDYVKPGGIGGGADDHKVLYNYITMTQILSETQNDYRLLEYFDEKGQFHQNSWETSDGFIHRSANFDQRNKQHPLSYTSLIIDVWAKESRNV